MMSTRGWEYLGDGVYGRYDGYHVVLSTSNGLGFQNTIYLDDDVQDSVIKFIQKCHKGKEVQDGVADIQA